MADLIKSRAYPRIGLMGNPTDAIGGSAIAVTFSNYWAEVTLTPKKKSIQLIVPEVELPKWDSIDELMHSIHTRGYYGGRRLMLAVLSRFYNYCKNDNIKIPDLYFDLTWESNIPPRVGLAGSSALLTAALRSILTYYQIDIPKKDQVDMVLKSETENLGIPAGYMDRVAQVYEGLTFYELNQNKELVVEEINPDILPALFIAIDENSSEGTEVFHSTLRSRFLNKDTDVLKGLKQQTILAYKCRDLLKEGKGDDIGSLMDDNFEIRRKLVKLNPQHELMVERARQVGAHVKFAGSGGTIVGTCKAEQMINVINHLKSFGYIVFQPQIKKLV